MVIPNHEFIFLFSIIMIAVKKQLNFQLQIYNYRYYYAYQNLKLYYSILWVAIKTLKIIGNNLIATLNFKKMTDI